MNVKLYLEHYILNIFLEVFSLPRDARCLVDEEASDGAHDPPIARVEFCRPGSVDGRPVGNRLMSEAWPLVGVRVLELSRFVGAAYAGKLLGELGADVLAIEPVAGHPLRSRPIHP